MGLFKRNSGPRSSHSDGPAEWAVKAREVDERVRQERAEAVAEPLGAVSVAERNSGRESVKVEELSEEYLRRLSDSGVNDGKFVRLGETIFLSPGPPKGVDGYPLMHQEIVEKAVRKDTRDSLTTSEEAIGPHGLIDAGKFDVFFLRDDEIEEDGLQGRFRVFSGSGSFGKAKEEGRQRTVDIAAQTLGEHVRVEDVPYKL